MCFGGAPGGDAAAADVATTPTGDSDRELHVEEADDMADAEDSGDGRADGNSGASGWCWM